MRRLTAAAALVASLGLAAPAAAFTPGPPFVLKGPLTFVKGAIRVPCVVALDVSPGGPPGGGVVTAARITGAPICATVTAAGLTWAATELSLTSVQISNMGFVLGVLGPCGPASPIGAWSHGRRLRDQRDLVGRAAADDAVGRRPEVRRLPKCARASNPLRRFGADVAELVDALDLGSSAARRGGSSPLIRTTLSRRGLGLDPSACHDIRALS